MSRLIPMSDLVADDLVLDRLSAREPAGSEPVAGLLAALADHADTPLTVRPGRRRSSRKHRYLGPFAALVVAASGAGVAAAVTIPHHAADPGERARVVKEMDAAARSDAPSALLSRLGLPRTTAGTDALGLVLARRGDGAIVLVPAAATTAQGAGVVLAALPATAAAPGALPADIASAGDEHGGKVPGGDKAGAGRPSGKPGGDPAGTAAPGSTTQKPTTGGGGSDTTGTDGATGGNGPASPTATKASKGGKRPTSGSTPTMAPTVAPTVTPTGGSEPAAAGTAPLPQTVAGPMTAPTAPRKQPSVALPGAGTSPTSAATPTLTTRR